MGSLHETLVGAITHPVLWGRSREGTDRLHYPLLPLAVIAASLPVTTWYTSPSVGYVLVGFVLVVLGLYVILFTAVPWTIDGGFLILIGGYWVGLVLHAYYHPHPEILPYIALTPIIVFVAIVLLSRFVSHGRELFTMGLATLGVVAVLIGIAMLVQEVRVEEELYHTVGDEIYGLVEWRMLSIFHNPNTTGFFMMITSFAAVFTYLSRRGVMWGVASLLCVAGLVLAEGDAALVGFAVGVVILLSGFDRRYGYACVALVILGIYLGIRVGHVPRVMQTTLMSRIDRSVAAIERLAHSPLWGVGFGDHSPEIGESSSPHNSYIRPLLNTGLIFGSLYIGALLYAFALGLRKAWTPWNTYVLGTATGIFAYMMFEELFLGGLSVHSIMLAIVLGLLLVPEHRPDHSIGTRAYGLDAIGWLREKFQPDSE